MTDSSQLPEEPPLIVVMRNHLTKLSEFVADQTFPRGLARMRVNGFRNQLIKIYGKDSSALKDFPAMEGELEQEPMREIPRGKLAISKNILAVLEVMPSSALDQAQKNRIFIGHGRSHIFQGHLGIRRAIVLIEDGCEEFSNIIGLTQIRFPKGDISARFEEIRRVLEREGVIPSR